MIMTILKCKNADKYKAIRPPTCNGGRPCETCKQKWESINRARAKKLERIRKEPNYSEDTFTDGPQGKPSNRLNLWKEENEEQGLK